MVQQIAEPWRGLGKDDDPERNGALTDLELNLLLEGMLRFSGLDFRDFAQSTLKRRVIERMRAENVHTVSGLQERVLHDSDALSRFVFAMSGGRSQLFRDASFYSVFRSRIVPLLKTYSFVRIWVPNCASGEDAYALAVVLSEEGLLRRSMIYATDTSELGISIAKRGVFEIGSAEEVKGAHRATGAQVSLSESCELTDGSLSFDEKLRKNMIFAQHSLVADGSLNEFHLILAPGVLPQFNKALQFRVHNLFLASLIRLGFLCLGPSESIKGTPHERIFREISEGHPIYRRMR